MWTRDGHCAVVFSGGGQQGQHVNTYVLIVYLEPFHTPQTDLLITWRGAVHYWPRSYAHTELELVATVTDWWLLFSNPVLADVWLLKYPEQSRIIRTLFD